MHGPSGSAQHAIGGAHTVQAARRRKTRAARAADASLALVSVPQTASILGTAAESLLGRAAELVTAFGANTLSAGLAELRLRGAKPAAAQERTWRALDAAAAFLRHPRRARAVVQDAVAFAARHSVGGIASQRGVGGDEPLRVTLLLPGDEAGSTNDDTPIAASTGGDGSTADASEQEGADGADIQHAQLSDVFYMGEVVHEAQTQTDECSVPALFVRLQDWPQDGQRAQDLGYAMTLAAEAAARDFFQAYSPAPAVLAVEHAIEEPRTLVQYPVDHHVETLVDVFNALEVAREITNHIRLKHEFGGHDNDGDTIALHEACRVTSMMQHELGQAVAPEHPVNDCDDTINGVSHELEVTHEAEALEHLPLDGHDDTFVACVEKPRIEDDPSAPDDEREITNSMLKHESGEPATLEHLLDGHDDIIIGVSDGLSMMQHELGQVMAPEHPANDCGDIINGVPIELEETHEAEALELLPLDGYDETTEGSGEQELAVAVEATCSGTASPADPVAATPAIISVSDAVTEDDTPSDCDEEQGYHFVDRLAAFLTGDIVGPEGESLKGHKYVSPSVVIEALEQMSDERTTQAFKDEIRAAGIGKSCKRMKMVRTLCRVRDRLYDEANCCHGEAEQQ